MRTGMATHTTMDTTLTAPMPETAQASTWQRLPLPEGPTVLALGAGLKNTLCAALGHSAMITPTVGDLDTPQACAAHEDAARALLTWLDDQGARPAAVAHDLHPDFHSTRTAQTLAAELGVRCLPVQHHHAHLAAVCAEHGWLGPVVGLALDGVGLGTDGHAWGGELLLLQGPRCTRLGHLHPLALPGGDVAAREPWRMAAAALHALGRNGDIATRFAHRAAAPGVARLLAQDTRCPPTTSLGRVFDAASALLGLCEVMQTEAEAAIALEQAAARHGPCPPLEGGWRIAPDMTLDLRPLLQHLMEAADPGQGAALFHATLGAALAEWLALAARSAGTQTVAAGGGCLFNRLLTADLRQHCRAQGLRLLEARQLPPGDTAIAYGQAAAARQQLEAA
jgi:hydrogenase maturation protein HypF